MSSTEKRKEKDKGQSSIRALQEAALSDMLVSDRLAENMYLQKIYFKISFKVKE